MKILFLIVLILVTGCSEERDLRVAQQANKYWGIIQNNQDAIERRMNSCLERSNRNRDVVSNDSEEVVEACQDYAWESVGLPSGLMMSFVVDNKTI